MEWHRACGLEWQEDDVEWNPSRFERCHVKHWNSTTHAYLELRCGRDTFQLVFPAYITTLVESDVESLGQARQTSSRGSI